MTAMMMMMYFIKIAYCEVVTNYHFGEIDDNYESINCCLNFKNCPSQKQKGDDRPAKIVD
ncbi:hypothetical protein T05_7877 [Trichinella murrelli]|uniref:PiggyBac transposable element-derived protein domain-containing protein n=1 Tax=Trichinella murrelli TaxID=144512 RepID=A0A0V0U4R6_9BILA|nr:hypothetical protein T05_7877 [Trichinella murrelli]